MDKSEIADIIKRGVYYEPRTDSVIIHGAIEELSNNFERLELENERLKKFEHDASYELTQLKRYVQNLIEKDSKIQADKAELVDWLKNVKDYLWEWDGDIAERVEMPIKKELESLLYKHSPE